MPGYQIDLIPTYPFNTLANLAKPEKCLKGLACVKMPKIRTFNHKMHQINF
ncbi:hypothetical protein D1BOALGB6SA_2609 [Olavius sp. associated proteobacterium Delta 1]|nr:hypothetical protein D1BOALGB6SA_2609 [Olavius sp. associated proteobacterium Delta 1]